ncbi:MAG: hypothetical protein IJW29_07410 [Clostridia bacterium]|nr:hypothetical protein [Clostridia bacterium]
MRHFFEGKSIFEVYDAQFNALTGIKKCKYHKAFTAAYLFVISDFMLTAEKHQQMRAENSKRFSAFLEGRGLSKEEHRVFDDAVKLLERVAAHETEPRGGWCRYRDTSDCFFYNLHLCYGDLLYAPDCLKDYQNAPILLKGDAETGNFADDMSEAYDLLAKYMAEIAVMYVEGNV